MFDTLLVQVAFFVYGILYLLITFKIRNLPGKTKKDTANEILYSLLWFAGGLIYPFSYSRTINPALRTYLNIFTSFAMVGIFGYIFFEITRQKVLVTRNPSLKDERTYEKFSKRFDDNYTLKMDIARKAFHGFVPAFVIALYVIAILVHGLFSLGSIISAHDIGIFLIINIGFGGLFLFGAADLLRLSWFLEDIHVSIFHLTPTSILNILSKRMHKHELYTFIPTVLILLSFIPFLPFPFPVFASITLIASVSDAMASIIGKLFHEKYPTKGIFPGKNYRFFKNKNIAGYFAGFISTFVVVLIPFLLIHIEFLSIGEILIIALLASAVFLLIDITSPPINDNFLNSAACGVLMVLLLLLFQ